jgi:hypothetical protein
MPNNCATNLKNAAAANCRNCHVIQHCK